MIRFIHPTTGIRLQTPVGFSWTTFFFGPFVPLKRGMHGTALIHAMLTVLTLGGSNLIFAIVINKQYANHLLDNEYIPATEEDILQLTLMGVFVDPKISLTKLEVQPTPQQQHHDHAA